MSEHVGMYFKKISEKLEKRANANAHKREFTFSQGKVLWYLHKCEGENVTMRDIERFLDCSHATVSGLVSRLEEKGLVSIEQSTSDRRAKVVKLTEKETQYKFSFDLIPAEQCYIYLRSDEATVFNVNASAAENDLKEHTVK